MNVRPCSIMLTIYRSENGSVTLTITWGNELRTKPTPSPFPNSRASSRNRPNTLVSKRSLSDPSIGLPDQKSPNTTIVASSPPPLSQDSKKRLSVASEAPSISESKSYMFEFRVQDTGPGIPDDQQQKVFEPFVQGELGLNKKYGGTGLGLSIC